MNSGKARKLYVEYSGALAYVEVESLSGDLSIGSAFHVGEGVFVTARHVVDGRQITEVCMTERQDIPLSEDEKERATGYVADGEKIVPVRRVDNGVLRLKSGPFFHSDPLVDVAVFQVWKVDPDTSVVPLGSHLDDWLGQSDFVLTEAVILGYPPIPMTKSPALVGARAEVNAQVDLYDAPHVHFILSVTARGGFSGGVAFSEYGFALGLVTRSLIVNGAASDSGYMSVLTIEPIYQCLAQHKMLPALQAESWDGLWNTVELYFTGPEFPPDLSLGVEMTASIAVFDDGKLQYLQISCDNDARVYEEATQAVQDALGRRELKVEEVRPGMCKVHIERTDGTASAAALSAGQSLSRLLMGHGYRPIRFSPGANDLLPPDCRKR
ncbi:serine protease [Streptomyces sp. NPDC006195]|uniref:S1 family peptidase n=1 Tax=unclassified Streptomyces TaxID=2593676 RepID=UPI0033B0A56A